MSLSFDPDNQFVPGWTPNAYREARARVLGSGKRYATIRADAAQLPAYSLSQFRLRHLEQGQAGTCWVHAATQLAEVFAAGNGGDAFPICRMLVGWSGKRLEGGGNPTNGGSPTDAVEGMTSDKGPGIAHESLWPYSDSRWDLAKSPADAVLADAKSHRLIQPVDVKSDDDARQLLSACHPIANGIWWPYGWDDSQTFMTSIGRGSYGHALLEIGYVAKGVWDDHDWFQLDNWHGLLYPPLPADKAAKVPGYKPISADKTSDFWVRADVYQTVRNYGNAERVSATDLDGFGHLFTLEEAIAL
jgi:hypothetical protein